jgi:mannose-6-phosphate isomerase-like protein (cupin superfamily)
MVIKRPWGEEEIIVHQPTYMGKILRRKAGTKGDLQSHMKHESHYLLEGRLRVTVMPPNGHAPQQHDRRPGDSWHVPAGFPHQEEALTDCVELEISEPTLNDRKVIEASPDAGLPSTSPQERHTIARTLARAYLTRAMELLGW